jgi:hypothetical protein
MSIGLNIERSSTLISLLEDEDGMPRRWGLQSMNEQYERFDLELLREAQMRGACDDQLRSVNSRSIWVARSRSQLHDSR